MNWLSAALISKGDGPELVSQALLLRVEHYDKCRAPALKHGNRLAGHPHEEDLVSL